MSQDIKMWTVSEYSMSKEDDDASDMRCNTPALVGAVCALYLACDWHLQYRRGLVTCEHMAAETAQIT